MNRKDDILNCTLGEYLENRFKKEYQTPEGACNFTIELIRIIVCDELGKIKRDKVVSDLAAHQEAREIEREIEKRLKDKEWVKEPKDRPTASKR